MLSRRGVSPSPGDFCRGVSAWKTSCRSRLRYCQMLRMNCPWRDGATEESPGDRGCFHRSRTACAFCLAAASAKSAKRCGQNTRRVQQRDLRDLSVLYVFLDGLYEPLRMHGIQREAVLCAWAITTEGDKVLLSLALGNKESYDAWLSFLRDLVSRGLPVQMTITSDGAPGLLQAIDEGWPKVKAHLNAIRDAPTREAGEATARDVLKRFSKDCPSLCAALSDDLEALLNHLRVPWRHRNHVRTTNLIERSFVEERRRTKNHPSLLHREKRSQTRPCHADPRCRQRAARGHHSDGTGAAQPPIPGIGDPAR